MWEGNQAQVNALESIILGGAKKILGCSSKTSNEAVRGDMGLETLKSRRDKAKLKWWYSGTSLNGPSEKRPTSLQRTLTKGRIDFSMYLMQNRPPRSDHFSAPDSGHSVMSRLNFVSAKLPLNNGHLAPPP